MIVIKFDWVWWRFNVHGQIQKCDWIFQQCKEAYHGMGLTASLTNKILWKWAHPIAPLELVPRMHIETILLASAIGLVSAPIGVISGHLTGRHPDPVSFRTLVTSACPIEILRQFLSVAYIPVENVTNNIKRNCLKLYVMRTCLREWKIWSVVLFCLPFVNWRETCSYCDNIPVKLSSFSSFKKP